MKRITILAAAGALLAFPAIGTTAAFAATDDSAAHVRVHAKHGADDPAGHHRHHRADDKPLSASTAPTTPPATATATTTTTADHSTGRPRSAAPGWHTTLSRRRPTPIWGRAWAHVQPTHAVADSLCLSRARRCRNQVS